jgi:lipopolysaccharide biosynthesis regulator YciM
VAKHKEPTEKVMFQGAQILFESGDYATALLMFNQLEQTPVDPTLLPKIYPYLAVCYHETGDADSCLANIRLAIDNKSPEMKELLGYIFAEGVLPNEYYDYYYYRIHGQWPM